jgi:CheY-like chemotaxis protein
LNAHRRAALERRPGTRTPLFGMHVGADGVHGDGEGGASEFTVWPTLRGTALGAVSDPDPATVHLCCRVLVVDDNRDAAEITALLLAAYGADARHVYDGASALAMAMEFKPHVMLLDIGLPDVDGFTLCRELRSAAWAGDMALLAISGWGQPEDIQRSFEAGFERHLIKPIESLALIKAIVDALSTR